MKYMSLACVLLILCFATALGQKAKQSETMTVRGCLKRSRQNYVVIDSHGFSYVLKGVGKTLDGEVGQEVEARGNLTDEVKSGVREEKQGSNPSDTVGAVEGATLEIVNVATDVRRVSDSCR